MRDKVPGLGIGTGGRRGHHCLDLAGRKGLRNVGCLNLNRRGLGQRCKFFQRGVIGAELQPGQTIHGFDLAIGIKALRRPRDREQRLHPLFGQKRLNHRFLRGPKLFGLVIAGGQERLTIDAIGGIFIGQAGQQDLSGRNLAGPDGVLDLGMRKQRSGGMHGDL